MMINAFLLTSPRLQRLLVLGLFAATAAAVLLAVMPGDALAAVGGGSGGGLQEAKNFQKNGLSTAKAVGVVVFAVVAIFSIARGTLGGKAGQGLIGFAVACLGMSVTLDPQTVMDGIGGWATGLFESSSN